MVCICNLLCTSSGYTCNTYCVELQKANHAYKEKVSHGHNMDIYIPDQTMFILSWDILFHEVGWSIDVCGS